MTTCQNLLNNTKKENGRQIQSPDPLVFDGNVTKNLRKIECEYEIFIAVAHGEKPAKTRLYIFLNLTGPKALMRLRSQLQTKS